MRIELYGTDSIYISCTDIDRQLSFIFTDKLIMGGD